MTITVREGPRSTMRMFQILSLSCAVVAIALGCKPEPKGVTTPLHEAAAGGHVETVRELVAQGADPNARDEQGRTPLHRAGENGHGETAEALLQGGADVSAVDDSGKTAEALARGNDHTATADRIANFGRTPVSSNSSGEPSVPDDGTHRLRPDLKYPDEAAFARTIGEDAIVMSSEHVYLFAPATRKAGADVVFPYLIQAYDALYAIVGQHTEHAIAVYAFPRGHPDASGGTSNCVIWYDDANLRLDEHDEWRTCHMPHVSGYIEEMAHNFVSSAKAQFGWEAFGWSLAARVASEVAPNAVYMNSLAETRRIQAETYRRYVEGGMVFPADIPANQVDRIHAYLLHDAEQRYGPAFWQDVFTQFRNERTRLVDAVDLAGNNETRNTRYQITLACINRVVSDFESKLRDAGISTTVDIKSLDPESPTWKRVLR